MRSNAVTVDYFQDSALHLEVDQITKEERKIPVFTFLSRYEVFISSFLSFFFITCPSCLSFHAHSRFCSVLLFVLCSCSALVPPGGTSEYYSEYYKGEVLN
ncbi:hypothetical protein ILYODFUR_003511 [Ilyodon furcidens]|uniref:Uncharacterized protein n=1 Tax=Ilyodon furcidens TaxID=33524 RepID=A0ABV0U2E2_9TELE